MSDYRIDCINKPDRNSPHEHITHAGGPKPDGDGRWRDSVPNIVRFIDASAWVGVRTSAAGNKFIQTFADGVWKDNLLALRECG
jgi:hypothetical protein